MILNFFRKMAGASKSPPAVGLVEIFWSWLASFLGIAAVALLHYQWMEGQGLVLIVGSFGA